MFMLTRIIMLQKIEIFPYILDFCYEFDLV